MKGTIQPFKDADGRVYFRGRIKMVATGKRAWIDVPAELERDEVKSRAYVEREQAKELATAPPKPVAIEETVDTWMGRWFTYREDRGLTSVSDDRSRYANHVKARLGTLAMARVTKDEVESLVEDLDRKVRAAHLSWKTAAHIWGLVTSAFADAENAKRRDLRVRDLKNPTTGVRGPDRGPSKAKAYLYPAEFDALVSHPLVPHRWRRMFAITTYLYARAGEVNALTWDDIDLDRGVALIHTAVNRRTGEISTTKSEKTRRVPIDPALLPLLRAMHEESGGVGRVSPIDATDKKLSRQLTRCLQLAGVTRADLFAGDATRKAITFHDLRGTGITWCAVRGDDPLKIKQRAGHSSFSTTEGYIREAENLREANFGVPFGPLPDALLKPESASKSASNLLARYRNHGGGAGNRTRVRKFRGHRRLRAYSVY